jgi:4-coumarate--CoA ligase
MAAAPATKQDDTAVAASAAYSSNSNNGSGNDDAAAGNKFYSAATGVYSSTHPPLALPADPSLSLVTHLFATAGLPVVPGSNMSIITTHPDSPCLVDAATSHAVSRADLGRLVSSLAAGLRRRHRLRKGDVVLLLLPNSVAFPVAFLAVLAAGAVATTMNPSSAAAEIAERVRDTRPALVLAAPGDESVAKLPPSLRVPVVLVPESFRLGDDDAPELKPFHELLADSGGDEAAAPAAVGQDDAAAILYSSGTGGRSKGAVLTHRNLIATVELFVRFETSRSPHAVGGGDVYLAALPMFHVYGLALFVVGLLALPPGSTVVVMRRFDAGEAVEVIRRYGVTHFPLVPPIMAALVAAAGSPAAALGLDSLVQVSSGAAPASRKLINEFLEAFPHVDFVQVCVSLTPPCSPSIGNPPVPFLISFENHLQHSTQEEALQTYLTGGNYSCKLKIISTVLKKQPERTILRLIEQEKHLKPSNKCSSSDR